MFRARSRLLVAAAATVACLGLLAGCGGGGSSDGKAAAAKEKTHQGEDPAAFVTKLTDAMTKKRTAQLDLELGSSLSATADVDYAGTGTSMAMRMITGTQRVNVVLADGVMYLQQTKGSKYLKIDKSDPALGSLLGQLDSFGPKSALENLKSGITKVVHEGPEKIDGQSLEHYRLTVDTKKAEAIFGVAQGSAKTPKTLTYDIWVDDEYLLRQVKMTVSGQALVMKASKWGEPVSIKVPPASQVMTR